MSYSNVIPELNFFRTTPKNLMTRPPLCSSLQNLESSFFLVMLGRFPHALVMCASAIESAMKSLLRIDEKSDVKAGELYKMAAKHCPAISGFDRSSLRTFRNSRNRIVHYGFSPKDDEETAQLLLSAGYPYLIICYKKFFDFDLLDGLVVEFSGQLKIALDVYSKTRELPNQHFSYCFRAFSHLVRWSIRESLMPEWENDASIHAEETGFKFEQCEKLKSELKLAFGTTWVFDCPICDDIATFVCELDEDHMDEHVISLERGMCASCGFTVPYGSPYLADYRKARPDT
jgi:hypothetical protein